MESRKYLTPDTLLASLADLPKSRAKLTKIDIQRMRRQVVFDRLVVSSPWNVRRCYAMLAT